MDDLHEKLKTFNRNTQIFEEEESRLEYVLAQSKTYAEGFTRAEIGLLPETHTK